MRLEENPGAKRAYEQKDREGKGIGLSRRFFEAHGLPMLRQLPIRDVQPWMLQSL